MKKLIAALLTLLLLAGVAACQSPAAGSNAAVQGSLEEIMAKIYAGAKVEMPELVNTEITGENSKYYLGVENMEFNEALASEPLMNASPHSVCLVRLNDDQDVEAVKKQIKENVDPFKWVCVGVQEDEIVVDNIGDLVVLIMSADADALHESFLTLKN
ncbi:MAG: hypothetical protein AAGU74_13130 [Bacillota bacterium]